MIFGLWGSSVTLLDCKIFFFQDWKSERKGKEDKKWELRNRPVIITSKRSSMRSWKIFMKLYKVRLGWDGKAPGEYINKGSHRGECLCKNEFWKEEQYDRIKIYGKLMEEEYRLSPHMRKKKKWA